ncbi:MAG: hypothetical protein JXA54_01765 [Candidatus Heimdallarchaeota archaeon]|nr:hypothetical protein [Candidatus Heimdallarchaeota archaeon]
MRKSNRKMNFIILIFVIAGMLIPLVNVQWVKVFGSSSTVSDASSRST